MSVSASWISLAAVRLQASCIAATELRVASAKASEPRTAITPFSICHPMPCSRTKLKTLTLRGLRDRGLLYYRHNLGCAARRPGWAAERSVVSSK